MTIRLNEIRWPLYHIRVHDKLEVKNNITTILAYGKHFTVDNKNLKGNTLGKRRIILKDTFLYDTEIYPLKKVFYTLYDVLRHKHKSRVYIDSNGEIFRYKKNTRCGLLYRKIEKIEVQGNHLFCYIENIFKPIVVPFIPKHMPKYLGLLVVYGDYILYELSDVKKKNSWRLI